MVNETLFYLNLVIGVIINSMDEAHKEVDRTSKENAETIQDMKAKLKEFSLLISQNKFWLSLKMMQLPLMQKSILNLKVKAV